MVTVCMYDITCSLSASTHNSLVAVEEREGGGERGGERGEREGRETERERERQRQRETERDRERQRGDHSHVL